MNIIKTLNTISAMNSHQNKTGKKSGNTCQAATSGICFCILFLFVLISLQGQIPYTVVGTGVVKCYDSIAQISCPADSSAPYFGQEQGLTPSYRDNGDGTVTDLNTGLMWLQARGSKMSWDSAFLMASQCSTGGYSDWRVPTIKEIYSLINFNGKSGPTASQCIAYIDTNYFQMAYGNLALGERIIDAQDWSATKYKGLTMAGDSTVFGVNFVDGRIKGYPQYKPGKGNTVKYKLYVRFVRGNTSYGINDFVSNGDSTITDSATGLMWMQNDSRHGMNWKSALAWAQEKNGACYLGYHDWRLPTAKELQSLVDYTRCKDYTNSAAIDPVFYCSLITDEGGNQNWPFYWANTTHLDNMGGVYVAFGEALGWMKVPPTMTYYTLEDVHGAGAQRSDPKFGSYLQYFLGYDQNGHPVYGRGPQGDVIRIDNYVRLVRSLSSPSGIEGSSNRVIRIYPNPSSGDFNVKVHGKHAEVFAEVRNIMGQTVKTSKFCHVDRFEFSLRDQPCGIYFLFIRNENYRSTVKIIKQ